MRAWLGSLPPTNAARHAPECVRHIGTEIRIERLSRGYLCENMVMARGWESKDVESQVQDRKTVAENPRGQKSAEDIKKEQEKSGLVLSRTRVKNDLENATNPNHRKSLEAALEYLDKKIGELS